jgi:hypothetical protein
VRIHLDPVGGVAGDMFVAALLDAWPEREARVHEALAAVELPASVAARVVRHADHALTGTRFVVEDTGHGHGHAHTPFRAIRTRLERATLAPGVRARALDIFRLLAEVEGKVHGCGPEEVTFHEIGAWDSIADIVAAAALIESSGARVWSVGPLPLGSGRVQTAHGSLPVPAPATVLLLQGLPVHDDGLPGERVTPTGAAILRHLRPAAGAPSEPMRLARTGIGFGTRALPGTSNVLRVLAFDALEARAGGDRVCVLRFEVDDQSPEDLAVGLERLREVPGVLDVLQSPAFGKKGRLCVAVQVLASPEAREPALAACFQETTTLGVRIATEERATLVRRDASISLGEGAVRVKAARRPSGRTTAKAEMDDLAGAPGGHAEREARRREAEAAVEESDDGD